MIARQRRVGAWILFDAPVPTAATTSARDDAALLIRSGQLPGGVKFARSPDHGGVQIRAEVRAPTPADDDPGKTTLRTVQAGFAAAAAWLGFDTAPIDDAEATKHPNSAVRPALSDLCAEAGWPPDIVTERGVSVDIGGSEHCLTAHIERCETGILVASELTRVPDIDGPCREALAALLLDVNATHRMVRAVLRQREGPDEGQDETVHAALETWIPADACAEQLRDAIAATAVAGRHAAIEAHSLARDEHLARCFLARRYA